MTVTLAGRFGSPVVVIREKRSTRALPIYVGPNEAAAIWQRLSRDTSPRPLTHDLIKGLLDASDVALERAEITGERNRTYVATLQLRVRGRTVSVDSRPSDASPSRCVAGGPSSRRAP